MSAMQANFSERDLTLMIRALGDGEHPENVLAILAEMRTKVGEIAGTQTDAEIVRDDPVDWADLAYRLDCARLSGDDGVHLARITRGLDEAFDMRMGIGLSEEDEGPSPQ